MFDVCPRLGQGEIKQKETKLTKCFGIPDAALESSEEPSFSSLSSVKALLQCTPYIKRPTELATM
jgi:hypothetical protein